jgi:hypothetical protein
LLLEALTVTPDWQLLDLPLRLDDDVPDEPPFFNPAAFEQDQFVFELV